MTVHFGFRLISCQRYPGTPRSDHDLYRQAPALAEGADAFGVDSVWVSEHHFVDDAYLPSLLPMCAAIAARTVIGSPDEVAKQIDEYRRAVGRDLHFIAWLSFPGLPWEVRQRTLQLFAEQVAPRAHAPAAGGVV